MKTFKELLIKMKDCKKEIEKRQIMDAFEDWWKNKKDAKVLAKEIKEKWTSELLECDDCCYSYRSVHPTGLYNLECPSCGNISKHNKIYDTNHERLGIDIYNSINKKNNKLK